MSRHTQVITPPAQGAKPPDFYGRMSQCRYIGVWLLNILSPLLYISLGAVLAFPEVWTFGVAESLPDHTRVSYGFLSCPISEEPVQSLSNYLSQFVEIIGGRVEDAQLALAGRKTELAIQDLTALVISSQLPMREVLTNSLVRLHRQVKKAEEEMRYFDDIVQDVYQIVAVNKSGHVARTLENSEAPKLADRFRTHILRLWCGLLRRPLKLFVCHHSFTMQLKAGIVALPSDIRNVILQAKPPIHSLYTLEKESDVLHQLVIAHKDILSTSINHSPSALWIMFGRDRNVFQGDRVLLQRISELSDRVRAHSVISQRGMERVASDLEHFRTRVMKDLMAEGEEFILDLYMRSNDPLPRHDESTLL